MRHVLIGLVALGVVAGLFLRPLPLLLSAPTPAWAGEEGEGDSAAERAFRDAWWSETTDGALDVAVRRYEAAAAAEGPDAVRARALYRLAVVLERMGKTEDAIRALERLAQRFPDEAELQAKARERLEAWTAADLRTNFDEWYRRYQYSPEFQARIVELILSLSDTSLDARPKATAAMQELLTIGAPAVPALKAHLETANKTLQSSVVSLLMRLGEIPSVRHLEGTTTWRHQQDSLEPLLALPEPERQAMRAELRDAEDGYLQYLLGPKAAWHKALLDHPSQGLLSALLGADPDPSVVQGLCSLVGWSGYDSMSMGFNRTLAAVLFERRLVTDAQVTAWLQSPSSAVSRYAGALIAKGEVAPPGVFEEVLRAMNAVDPGDQVVGNLWQALIATLPEEPTEDQWKAAVAAIERLYPGGRVFFYSPGNLRGVHGVTEEPLVAIYEALVDHARSPTLVRAALEHWDRFAEHDPLASRRLLQWAISDLDPEVSRYAAAQAGKRVSGDTLDDALDALAEADPEMQSALLRAITSHPQLTTLPWSDDRVSRAVGILQAVSDPRTNAARRAASSTGALLHALLATRERVVQLVRLVLERPEAVHPWVAWSVPDALRDAAVEDVRSGIQAHWPSWSSAQRLAALEILNLFWGDLRATDPFALFLRERLLREDEASEEADAAREVKREIARLLPELDVEGMRAAYDLDTPEGAALALSALKHQFLQNEATYELLAKAQELPETSARRAVWSYWRRAQNEALRERVARDMTTDPDAEFRLAGLGLLATLGVGDVVLWTRLLSDSDAAVRAGAALLLGTRYDDEAILALVKALDDPAPEVRSAALASLEKIRDVEEKKAYWRKFAQDR